MTAKSIGAIFLALLLVGGVFAGPVSAGDGAILVYPDEEEYTVEPGEQLEIDIYASHHDSPGVVNLTLAGEYDESMLELTDVEFASWFEADDVDGEIRSDTGMDDPGSLTVSQEIDGTAEGVIATDRFVTLTFEADADATGTTTVDLEDSTVKLAGSDIQWAVLATSPEITIDEQASDSSDGSTDETGSDDDGAFPLPPAVFAVAALTLGVLAARAAASNSDAR